LKIFAEVYTILFWLLRFEKNLNELFALVAIGEKLTVIVAFRFDLEVISYYFFYFSAK
jgi:hypothetical protein